MRALALAAVILALASPALAGQPVALKAEPASAEQVTLGDIFEGAGRASGVVVALAARPGANVVLDAGAVQRLARANGLDWDNAQGLRRIIVRGGAAPAAPIQASTPTTAPARAGGVEALVYARNINTGEIVRADDLTWGKVVAAPADAPADAERVIGMAAKRPLRAGAAASTRDLAAAQVIKKDDMIQVRFQSGGVSLTLQAKALEAAAVGESFNVQNTASKRTIEAVAIGPGRAVVGPEAEMIRAEAFAPANPSQLAFR